MIHEIDLLSDDELTSQEPTYPSRYTLSNLSNSDEDDKPPILPPAGKKNQKEKAESKAAILRRERESKALDRKRKQALKPGNCLKLVKVVVCANLLQNDFAGDLIQALNRAEITYRIDLHPAISSSLSWERQDPLDEQIVSKEHHMLVFMRADEFVNLIATYQLQEKIKEIKSAASGSTLTLAIFGLEDYFRFQKTKKNRDFSNEVRGHGSKTQPRKGVFDDLAVVTREQVECSLAELQVLYNCGHCVFNQSSSVASYICQYTKAVAEAPYKLEKKGKSEEQLEWFALGDSRGTVRVDKQGNGLARLWRQQLCQFNHAGLESSDAIAYAYPTPKALTEAYDGLGTKDAEMLLQNISVRRGAGPLSSERRIGPQLSRKLHLFFTGDNGNMTISEDQ